MQEGIQLCTEVLALFPHEKDELDVLLEFLKLPSVKRKELLTPAAPTPIQHQMRQILAWFQSNSLEWKSVPHAVQQELAGAVKRHELEPAAWLQRMHEAFASTTTRVDATTQQRQQKKMQSDLDKRIAQKRELAAMLGKPVKSQPEQPPKRQRVLSDKAFVNATVAVLRFVYASSELALKKLTPQENNDLLMYEEHYMTLLMQMNSKLNEQWSTVYDVAVKLLVDDESFNEFEHDLSSLESDSLYRRVQTIKTGLEKAKSTEN